MEGLPEDEEERVPRMREPTIRFKPEHFLQLAHEQLQKNNPIQAIEFYITYLENLSNPQDMILVEQVNLTKLVMNLNSHVSNNEHLIVLKYFLAVLNKYPENAILLNACGVFFFSQGEYTVARKFLQNAANIGYLPGEKNFLHVIWQLIPRWHFRMLNDRKRNEAFKKAIDKAVKDGFKTVYDIGTGCGLLSLIAATSDPNVKVIAFEEIKVLADIAHDLFKINKVDSRVSVVKENSRHVETPPGSCNLIVTEIFDAGVFGEDCLKTIKDAIDRFPSEKRYRIIPAEVKLYVTAFECVEITQNFRYTKNLPELKLENVCLTENSSEPYDAEYLKNKKVKYLTDTKCFLHVHFFKKKKLEELLVEECDTINEIELEGKQAGNIHGLTVWFDLQLDENTTISTHPENDNNLCWEQAIFHSKHTSFISPDEKLIIKPKMSNGQIKFEFLNQQSPCEQCFQVSKEIITFLNDEKLVVGIKKAVDSLKDVLELKIVDFNIFPLFGFLAALRGAIVYHVYQNQSDLVFLSHVVALHQLPAENFIFIHHKQFEEYMIVMEIPELVYTNYIRTDGSWSKDQYMVEDAEAKLNCASIPRKIFVKAQLISSSYLTFCNKVDDSNALKYKISDQINQYSGSEHPNLEKFHHKKHSSIVTFDISDPEVMDLHEETDIIKNGSCNAILYWFDMQFTEDEENVFSTLDSTHYDKCCTLLSSVKNVRKGEKYVIHILRLEGHLKVYCD